MKLYDWLEEQPFTLSMSSGFFSFFAHAGMLAALVDHGLKPAKLTGSSAGALVGGCYASGCSVDELKTQLFALQRDDFWDPGLGLGLLKGDLFRDQVRNICKVSNVEECPIPFRVSAFNLGLWDTEVIDRGCLTHAIAASCAVSVFISACSIKWWPYPGERIFYHHIGSRSPWRRKNSPALQMPQVENMQTITISGLPRVGPNKLQNGVIAFEYAYDQTGELLQQTITAA